MPNLSISKEMKGNVIGCHFPCRWYYKVIISAVRQQLNNEAAGFQLVISYERFLLLIHVHTLESLANANVVFNAFLHYRPSHPMCALRLRPLPAYIDSHC